jgi:hypothetical protein
MFVGVFDSSIPFANSSLFPDLFDSTTDSGAVTRAEMVEAIRVASTALQVVQLLGGAVIPEDMRIGDFATAHTPSVHCSSVVTAPSGEVNDFIYSLVPTDDVVWNFADALDLVPQVVPDEYLLISIPDATDWTMRVVILVMLRRIPQNCLVDRVSL